MYFQLVDYQALSTQGQPDGGVNLRRPTAVALGAVRLLPSSAVVVVAGSLPVRPAIPLLVAIRSAIPVAVAAAVAVAVAVPIAIAVTVAIPITVAIAVPVAVAAAAVSVAVAVLVSVPLPFPLTVERRGVESTQFESQRHGLKAHYFHDKNKLKPSARAG